MTAEQLEQASQSAQFTLQHLSAAHKGCTALQSIAILPLIHKARELLNEVNALHGAIEADAAEKVRA